MRKTRIMYQCNLSTDLLNKYLQNLIQMELLGVVRKSMKEYYQTTEKGQEFLRTLQKLEILAKAQVPPSKTYVVNPPQ